MDNLSLIRMEAGNIDDAKAVLTLFIEQYYECFDFKHLEKDNVFQRLWTIVYRYLMNPEAESIHDDCLKSVRILTRDRYMVEKLINRQRVDALLELAALKGHNIDKIPPDKDFTVAVEALKCLCNLVYSCPKAQSICSANGTLDGIIRRLRMHADPDLPHVIKFLDMKLLYLITTLTADVRIYCMNRPRLRGELHAMTYLMEALDVILKEGGGYSQDNKLQYFPTLDASAVELSCEILKVLFNITVRILPIANEGKFRRSERLLTILRELLQSSTPPHVHDLLVRHIIKLLTNMPPSTYEMLIPQEDFEYNGEAMDVILAFLDRQLSTTTLNPYEHLSPVLVILTEGSRTHKVFRKYIRNRVLPPLNDETTLTKSEEGNTLRNKLCHLLSTTIITSVRNEVAEFLFVLCKENVNRMVKYTGYEEAASMFASRSLLVGDAVNPEYSSDSEDNEEYLDYKDKINPVTSCYEPHRTSELETMSVEQEEYEVMKLVDVMDKLQISCREDINQPSTIGGDRKPEPVEHTSQVVTKAEEIPKQQK